MTAPYDAILLVAFGGPEGHADVIPFLENVLRGRNVPRARLMEVAHHYEQFGGVSPINQQCRDLLAALRPALDARGIRLPLYWGNRNWRPLLADTVRQMADDGISRALAFVTSAYSSYSSCRQYRENIEAARQTVGAQAPAVDKVRAFFNHPRFVRANAARLDEACQQMPEGQRHAVPVVFTAHSIPLSMARECAYEAQLREACRLVAAHLEVPADRWSLAFQSRSGRPEDPWLEPDVCDRLRELAAGGTDAVVVMPIGFLSDHMEVLYDLDVEARAVAQELGLRLVRGGTVGLHPEFIEMVVDLISERLEQTPRAAEGACPALPDACPRDCCPPPRRPAATTPSTSISNAEGQA